MVKHHDRQLRLTPDSSSDVKSATRRHLFPGYIGYIFVRQMEAEMRLPSLYTVCGQTRPPMIILDALNVVRSTTQCCATVNCLGFFRLLGYFIPKCERITHIHNHKLCINIYYVNYRCESCVYFLSYLLKIKFWIGNFIICRQYFQSLWIKLKCIKKKNNP